jgi:geranylgeranyl pyrophosphate synthase
LNELFGNRNATDDDIRKVFTVFEETGSIEYARKTALDYNIKAKNALDKIGDSESIKILKELADYSIQREK